MNLSESFKNRMKKLAGLNESEKENFLYQVVVKHDGGKKTIKTAASSEESAKSNVCKAERCPESAIISVKNID